MHRDVAPARHLQQQGGDGEVLQRGDRLGRQCQPVRTGVDADHEHEQRVGSGQHPGGEVVQPGRGVLGEGGDAADQQLPGRVQQQAGGDGDAGRDRPGQQIIIPERVLHGFLSVGASGTGWHRWRRSSVPERCRSGATLEK